MPTKTIDRPQVICLMPRYDEATRTLWLGDTIVKSFRVPAENQILILMSFQELLHIDDPLPHKVGTSPKKRLKDALARLNENQINNVLRFRGAGDGRGILWEIIK